MPFLSDAWRFSTLNRKLVRERIRAYSAEPHASPLFVFGNQKSGTTAIAALLAAATGQTATLDFAGAKEPYASRLYRGDIALEDFIRHNAWAFSTGIVKEPALTFVAPQLMSQFPGARAILIVRDPFDNIRSILDRLRLAGDKPSLDAKGKAINPTWRAILNGSQLGGADVHCVSNLARRWLRAATICGADDDRITIVRYEDFNTDKAATIERLAKAAGLPLRQDVSHLVDHAFQRRAEKRTLSARQYFGAENFARIESICGEAALSLGYETPAKSDDGVVPAESTNKKRAPVHGLRPIPAHS
ncbi:MAG TPA: sulfotransferase [Rhizomicrobium sp.]